MLEIDMLRTIKREKYPNNYILKKQTSEIEEIYHKKVSKHNISIRIRTERIKKVTSEINRDVFIESAY